MSSKISQWCSTAVLESREGGITVGGISIRVLTLSLFSQNTQVFMFPVACELARGEMECSSNCYSSRSELGEFFDYFSQTAVQGELSYWFELVKVFEILPKR